MKHARAPIVLVALVTLVAAAARAGDTGELRDLEARLRAVAREAEPRTVLVYGIFGLGTGAVIDPAGTVVTNAHVAAGARFAVLVHPDGRRALARREGIDYERDLAVLVPLEPPGAPAPHFVLRESDPAPGEWVAALGYPGGPRGDTRPTFTIGRIRPGRSGGKVRASGIVPLDYGGALRSDTPIFFGNSGGPLVDLEGRLVGINGALSIERDGFHGLTIPGALVRERIATLRGGRVRLPGGSVLDPRESRLAKRLDDLLDPLVCEMMERRLRDDRTPPEELRRRIEAALSSAEGAAPALSDAVRARGNAGRAQDEVARGVERLLAHFRNGPRHAALAPLCERLGARLSAVRPLAIEAAPGCAAPGTLVPGIGIVATASRFPPDVRAVRTSDGLALVLVARSDAHDLLLFRPEHAAAIGGAPPAPAAAGGGPEVGSLVLAIGPAGVRAAGVVSAGARPVPFEGLASLEAPARSLGRRIARGVLALAESLGLQDVADLARSIIRSIELQESMRAGSPPRPYPWVFSVDAPLGPADAGATLVDREGRLLGVVAANAHFGTTYAVPIATVREVFAGK